MFFSEIEVFGFRPTFTGMINVDEIEALWEQAEREIAAGESTDLDTYLDDEKLFD